MRLFLLGSSLIAISSIIVFFPQSDLIVQEDITVNSTQIPQEEISGLIDTKSIASIQEVAVPVLPVGKPVKLMIPQIKVDSVLESVGLTSRGAVDIPKGPASAAWFDLGRRPGEEGTAVIVGHFGWKDGIPAVFDNLHKLRKGDKLNVLSDSGETISFVVRELKTYKEHEIVAEVFGSNDGKAHLNLITCQGVWNKSKKSYSNRLVVFTDLVASE